MLIKCPFKANNGSVEYPVDRSLWSSAYQYKNYLVGEFSGDLYLEDNQTKAFDWEVYDPDEDQGYGSIITVLAYSKRWHTDEKAMIEFMSLDNPSDTPENRLKTAGIRQSLKDMDRASFIDLSREDTRVDTTNFCKVLEQAGVITDYRQRSSEILDTPTEWEELPLFVQEQYLSGKNV